ncbi:holin [Lutispora sp.]|uniref:holin n=1 Tax=Lutispora sp. TaxID=2828727 RepID=UPI000EBB9F23|nr:holin [Lutispora sp.]MEA4963105.1 holin [Lutispora sp.]HCJ57127.1 hypothetical protein [Clostridiaceae bacterium]
MFNEAIIIPVIMAVIEILKGVGLPKRFGALAALILGIVIGIFFLDQPQIKLKIFQGIIYGLSASGLYSGAKNAIEEVRMRRK